MVNDVETDRPRPLFVSDWKPKLTPWNTIQLVNVGVEYAVDEADTRTFVRILIGKLDVDLPKTSGKRSCRIVPLVGASPLSVRLHTLVWSLESNIKFLP